MVDGGGQVALCDERGDGVDAAPFRGVDAGDGGPAHSLRLAGAQRLARDFLLRFARDVRGDAQILLGGAARLDALDELPRRLQTLRALPQRTAVGDQRALGLERDAVRDALEAVLAQRAPARRQVDDEVRVADGGRGLHRPGERLEREVVDVVPVQESARERGVLGGHAQLAPALLKLDGDVGEVGHRVDVDPRVGDGDDQLAAPVAERLDDDHGVAAFDAALRVVVESDEAQVGVAVFDAGGDVGVALKDDLRAGDGGDFAGVAARAWPPDAHAAGTEEVERQLVHHAVAGRGDPEPSSLFGVRQAVQLRVHLAPPA